MALFNINDFTPAEIAALLDKIDGITPEIAERLASFVTERGAIKDQEELLAKLKEFGVRANFLPGIEEAIAVGPASDQFLLDRDEILADPTLPRLPLLYNKDDFFISLATLTYQNATFPNIFAHLKGPDGRWYPVPDEKDRENVRQPDTTKKENIGKTRISVSKANGNDLAQFPGKPTTNPFLLKHPKQTNLVVAVKFEFIPDKPCGKNPPYTIIQTNRYFISDTQTKKLLGAETAIETNPLIAPFIPKAVPGGFVEYYDTPGPGIEELKKRNPTVKDFTFFFQVEQYVIDNCTNTIIGSVSWLVDMQIVLDANGNVDLKKSKAEVLSFQ